MDILLTWWQICWMYAEVSKEVFVLRMMLMNSNLNRLHLPLKWRAPPPTEELMETPSRFLLKTKVKGKKEWLFNWIFKLLNSSCIEVHFCAIALLGFTAQMSWGCYPCMLQNNNKFICDDVWACFIDKFRTRVNYNFSFHISWTTYFENSPIEAGHKNGGLVERLWRSMTMSRLMLMRE